VSENASEHAIFVHSHRRSGTHYLLDTMRAWFDVPEQIQNRWLRTAPYSLSKDHEPFRGFRLAQRHIDAPSEQVRHERRLYETGTHIYIVRNPLQVLRSVYIFDVSGAEQKFRVDPKTSFLEYLTAPSLHEGKTGLNRIDYWVTHVKSWYFDDATLSVHYDDLKAALADTLLAISNHIGLPVRQSPRPVSATGVATNLTKKFFAKGHTIHWDAEVMDAIGSAVERILGPKPWRGLERHMANWLSDPPLAS
jgi:Sulfotransferase domain